MEDEKWLRALEIWRLLKESSPESRKDILDEECGSDDELRQMVLEIEESYHLSQTDDVTLVLQPDELLGPYRILKQLGEGGMGQVYSALRTDSCDLRLDAVKIVPASQLSTELVARAAREAKQLRALAEEAEEADETETTQKAPFPEYRDHGRLPDGRPYLAMEYVDGLPLDQYCDDNKLPLRQSLELFVRVCDAVSLAHQAAILHRDLKPTNILVTPDGSPRIMDFGMAKDLTEDGPTQHTLTAEYLPRVSRDYASPEQLGEERLRTASDVYSLGVILYQMLTGELPVDFSGVPNRDLHRVAMETTVVPPSQAVLERTQDAPRVSETEEWAHRLKGDLDIIVLKALSKEPGQRYSTPDELAQDIKLHLAERPISARPPSWAYRAGKFFKRNQIWVGVGALFVLLIISAGWAQYDQYRETIRERNRAEIVKDFMVDAFAASNPEISSLQGPPTARHLLDEAAKRIGTQFEDDPETLADLIAAIARSYHGLGAYDRAQDFLRREIDLRERLGDQLSLALAQGQLARTLQGLARISHHM